MEWQGFFFQKLNMRIQIKSTRMNRHLKLIVEFSSFHKPFTRNSAECSAVPA